MCKLINIIPCLCILISSLLGSALRERGLPSDSMFVLEAEPSKLAIKRHSCKILYFFQILTMNAINLIRKFSALCVCILFVVYWFRIFQEERWKPKLSIQDQREFENDSISKKFLIDTPTCSIKYFDPFNISADHFNKLTRFYCPSLVILTYDIMGELHINWTAAKLPPYNNTVAFCTYIPIYRPKEMPVPKNFLQYLNESDPFYDSIKVNHEFVKVQCYNISKQILYVNFHAFIPRNASLDSMYHDRYTKHVSVNRISEHLNVVLLGIDSVSKNGFTRQMTKTKEYIRDKLGSIEMAGYNKVGGNTFPNIVPALYGTADSELPWNKSQSLDQLNFIWKQFSKKGYKTLLSEDCPGYSTFEYLKKGFEKTPVDHFYRPLIKAMSKEKNMWFEHGACFLNKLLADLMLSYLYKFMFSNKNNQYFAFTWINSLAHSIHVLAGPITADEQFYRFFRQCFEKGMLNDTVIFFLSDHGKMHVGFSHTEYFKYEKNLPFMYVYIPAWIKQKYPHIGKNLQLNKNRLLTPFDVHSTLQDILYFNSQIQPNAPNERGISWFREIPINRTCESAGIPDLYCSCLERRPLEITDPIVQEASKIIVKGILRLLKPYADSCATLNLKSIDAAFYYVKSQSINHEQLKPRNEVSYSQVRLTTTPGGGKFEAIVKIDASNNKYKLDSDINRLNLYGNQSACNQDFIIRNYCLCKELI